MNTTRNYDQDFSYIRWLTRCDLPAVVAIENASFEYPWTKGDFLNALRQRNVIGMVAEHQDMVIGYMVYELFPERIQLLSIAVHPDFRRQSVGAAMLSKLAHKLRDRRSSIMTEVRETNLDAQFFFRDCGFRAIGVLTGRYPVQKEDAYAFAYKPAVASRV